MPNWKKVITSGSNAELNNINSSGTITGTHKGVGSGANNKVFFEGDGGPAKLASKDQSTTYLNFGQDSLGIVANGEDTFNVLSNGVVRVGTTGESHGTKALQVHGDISCSGNIHLEPGNLNQTVFVTTGSSGTDRIRFGIGTATGEIPGKALTVSGSISASGKVITDRLQYNDNTYIDFNEAGENTIRLHANGAKVMDASAGTVHINPLDSAGVDFRVDGASDYLIFADAGEEKVSIGTNVLTSKLSVEGDLKVSSHITASGVISASGGFVGDGSNISNVSATVGGNTFATDLKIGRDADNLIDFTTDNQVTFRVSAGDGIVMKASGEIEATKFDGDLEGNADTATTATNATHVAVADNENTNEDNLIPFIEDASATGNVGLESDGDFHYNPSTGKLTATQLAGTLQTAAQTNITSVGTLSSVTVSGDVNANGNIVGDGATQLSGLTHITAIGNMALGNHATDDHTITGRTEIVGNITASGDISGSGAISTTSTIRGIMPQVISANMGGVALSTTTDTYIPLAEGELEGTNHDHVRVNLVAPFSGSLRRIVVRSNAAFGTNQAYTASLYVIHDDEVASGKTLAGHHQIGLDADKHSAHALVFDFANRVTGSNVINGGDRVLVSLKSSRNNSQNYYCTTVFAWDYHETTGIVTNSDGVIAGVGGI